LLEQLLGGIAIRIRAVHGRVDEVGRDGDEPRRQLAARYEHGVDRAQAPEQPLGALGIRDQRRARELGSRVIGDVRNVIRKSHVRIDRVADRSRARRAAAAQPAHGEHADQRDDPAPIRA